jgi:hypothetical protein
MIAQAFGEVQIRRDRKRARQVKSKVKSMLIIFFHIKGTLHLEFIQAGQTVKSTYYCNFYSNCVKMCKDFGFMLRKKAGRSSRHPTTATVHTH